MDELLEEFKQVYKEKGAHDFQSQIKYLSALADHYHQLGADNSDWVCLLKAHSLYNSVANRDKEGQKWSAKAFEVQESYWRNKVQISLERQQEITETVRRELTDIRISVQSKLDSIKQNYTDFDSSFENLPSPESKEKDSRFMSHMEKVTDYCTEKMVNLFNLIIRKAVELSGEPPCGFCAVGLGSLARGEATPYSDLEFLIEVKNPETAKYFEDLAMTVYFLTGNLQETKLRYMAIAELSDWFEDVSTNGIKIDGLQKWAGNIPTGNGSAEQRNHFICTVEELVSRYKNVYNNPDPADSLRGDLTAMLYCTVALYGDTGLLNNFRSGIRGLKHSTARVAANRAMLKNDVKKYDFNPDYSLCRTRNMKSDIYRYPSMLILNLRILHQVSGSPAGLINNLCRMGVLSQYAAHALRFSYCCALYIRLSAYLYHRSQNERISVMSTDPDYLATKYQWFMPRPLLLHMMTSLISLKEMTKADLLHIEDKLTVEEQNLSAAIVSFYCDDHVLCYNILKSKCLQRLTLLDPQLAKMTALCAFSMGLYEEAKACYLYCFSLKPVTEVEPQLGTANVTDVAIGKFEVEVRLGQIYYELGQYNPAKIHYNRYLKMLFKALGNVDHSNIAACYNDLGIVHRHQGDYELAMKYHTKALDMRCRLFKNSDHPDILFSRTNLAAVYSLLDQLSEAFHLYMDSLEMCHRLYGYVDHPVIAKCLRNLGSAHASLCEYQKAEAFVNKAEEMSHRMYGDETYSPEIDNLLAHGDLLCQKGFYDRAEECYTKALKFMLSRFGESSNYKITARCYERLGVISYKKESYLRAEEHLNKALKINKKLYGNVDHIEIAGTYDNLGSVFSGLRDCITSKMYYLKSLGIRQRIFGSSDHSYSRLLFQYRFHLPGPATISKCQRVPRQITGDATETLWQSNTSRYRRQLYEPCSLLSQGGL